MLNRRFFLAFFSILTVLVVALLSIQQSSLAEVKHTAKIYECLEVGQNLDCLKKHIARQYDTIDQFVLLESLIDQEGKNRELLYDSHKNEFETFNDKISYVVTSSFLTCKQEIANEFYLKNQYLKAMDSCSDQDIIIFSTSELAVNRHDLQKGIVWLEKHPEEIIKLKARNLTDKSSSKKVKAATFAHVKEMLPAGIEKNTKLTGQKMRWKSIFFPV